MQWWGLRHSFCLVSGVFPLQSRVKDFLQSNEINNSDGIESRIAGKVQPSPLQASQDHTDNLEPLELLKASGAFSL